MNVYLTKHLRRLTSNDYNLPDPDPLLRQLRRWRLLFLRSFWEWRCNRHVDLVTRSMRRRAEVLRQLSLDDEETDEYQV